MAPTSLLLALTGLVVTSAGFVSPSPALPPTSAGQQVAGTVQQLLDDTGEPVKVWIEFADKGHPDARSETEALARLEDTYDARAVARRARRRTAAGLFDARDLPVLPAYVNAVRDTGAEVHVESSWLNAVSATLDRTQLEAVAALPFVQRVELVRRAAHRDTRPADAAPSFDGTSFYGASQGQLDLINLPALHALGHTGQGIVIGVLDTGFNLTHDAFNDPTHPLQVVAAWDFINNDPVVGPEPGDDPSQHHHGTWILGALGAYQPNVVMGGAYDASFILCKTEDITSETPVEEDYYVAGLQYIEANGGDVMSSSLGYIDWYNQSDLDGLTAKVTIAVNTATDNGVMCCTAAGNYGNDTNPTTSALIAPSDAFDVISCGSVASTLEYSTFTSDGPTADGRVKPEMMAQGESVWTVSVFDDVSLDAVSGTSLSTPLVASAVACMAQGNPNMDVPSLRERLQKTGSYLGSPIPDPLFVYGYGILDALAAFELTGTWQDLGGGVAGTGGMPVLTGSGALVGTEPVTLALSSARPAATTFLVVGLTRLDLPFKGGTLVPMLDFVFTGLKTDGTGQLNLTGPWQPGLPSGFEIYLQHWVLDPMAVQGLAGSNALQGTTP